jgi:hypothetical protein
MQELPQATDAQLKHWSASKAQACSCSLGACAGWESITESRWPAEQTKAVATLRRADEYEPTFESITRKARAMNLLLRRWLRDCFPTIAAIFTNAIAASAV